MNHPENPPDCQAGGCVQLEREGKKNRRLMGEMEGRRELQKSQHCVVICVVNPMPLFTPPSVLLSTRFVLQNKKREC